MFVFIPTLELFIIPLGSNESEAEEDEVEKTQRKKRKGRKKAPKENKVGSYLLTSDCNKQMFVVQPM